MQPVIDPDNLPLLIFVNKGIEVGSNALTLEIIVDTWGSDVAKAATFIVRLSAFFCQFTLILYGSLDPLLPKKVRAETTLARLSDSMWSWKLS